MLTPFVHLGRILLSRCDVNNFKLFCFSNFNFFKQECVLKSGWTDLCEFLSFPMGLRRRRFNFNIGRTVKKLEMILVLEEIQTYRKTERQNDRKKEMAGRTKYD